MLGSSSIIDVIPILDEGAPTSTGGIDNAAKLCNILGMNLKLKPSRSLYHHRWGMNAADSKHVVASWYLTINDLNKKSAMFVFDPVEGESPLLIGLDTKQYSTTDNLSKPTTNSFKTPTDLHVKSFYTYIAHNDGQHIKLRIEIASHQNSSVKTLLSGIVKQTDLSLAKKLHRFMHTPPEERIKFLRDSGKSSPSMENACRKVSAACNICASSRRPHNKKKISLIHVNDSFNSEDQADTTVAYIRKEKYEILNMIDMGAGYDERIILTN